MAALLITAAGIIVQAVVQVTQTMAHIRPDFVRSSFNVPQLLGTLSSIVIIMAVVQTLWPKLREGLLNGALTYTSVIEYITYGERRK